MKKEHLVIGICAHVDAGKTTLSEGLLYLGGSIRKIGRVDDRDAFLDTDEMERARGITIFSKQAQFTSQSAEGNERTYMLLDTPGHADFSPEMERTLQVLDLAVLVISAADGVNAQVRTLWKLLEHYNVPVVIFVNKMDQMESIGLYSEKREELMGEIREKLSGNALEFAAPGDADGAGASVGGKQLSGAEAGAGGAQLSGAEAGAGGAQLSGAEAAAFAERVLADDALSEALALCDEALLNKFLEGEPLTNFDVRHLIAGRNVFPVFFGAALRMAQKDKQNESGVPELLLGLDAFAPVRAYPEEFGARVFKITRDGRERLTWMKITGGELSVRQVLSYAGRSYGAASDDETDDGMTQDKITQIRFYSGEKFTPLQTAEAGVVCAVCGLTKTYAGQGLGMEDKGGESLLVPVLTWQILLPQGEDPFKAYRNLCILEEEEPELLVSYNERKKEITAQLMGEIQREILKNQCMQRFGMEIMFGRPSVIYKETIAAPMEGVGHFEPLRHYAEVHLLLEPGEPGSGLVFDTKCSVDTLAKNWQRLILTHLRERRHRGVLTGSEITDMKITLIGGRAHEKHTEGGDFRQATYRAVRQGLMMAPCVLLEPVYNFRMYLPSGKVGRAQTDLAKMGVTSVKLDFDGDTAIMTGSAPVAVFGDYAETLASYTKGEGRVAYEMGGYQPCRNTDEVLAEMQYDPDADKRNPSASVFCSHGAGMIVPWYEVRNYMHVDSGWREGTPFAAQTGQSGASRAGAAFVEADYAAAVDKSGQGAAVSGAEAGGVCGSGQGTAGSSAEAGGMRGSGQRAAGSGSEAGGIRGSGQGTAGSSGEAGGTRRDGAHKGAGVSSAAEKTAAGGNSRAAGGFSSSEEPGSSDGYTDYGPAGYAGAESRRAAFKVAEGRTDTRSFKQQEKDILAAEDELRAIFERTYGPVKSRVGQSESYKPSRTVAAEIPEKYRKPKPKPQKEYLLVDGYNIIFSWENLRALAQRDIKAARDALLDDLSNYAGYMKANVICVFDAYKVAGGTEQVYRYHNIDVIFTKEAETADLYIEKAAHELTKQYAVKVATSDAVEQVIIYGAGAIRLSAMNFYEEVRSAEREMKATYVADDTDVRQRVGSSLKDELEKALAGTELPEETD